MGKYYALKFNDKFVCEEYNEKFYEYVLRLEELNPYTSGVILYDKIEYVENIINDIGHWFNGGCKQGYNCTFEEELLRSGLESLEIVELDVEFKYEENKF